MHAMTRTAKLAAAALVGALAAEAQAATTWTGLGGDNNWSTSGNWDAGSPAAGSDAIFANNDKTTSAVVNNIVDQNLTISSLTLINVGGAAADWHTMQISSGITLTLNGSSLTSPANVFTQGTLTTASGQTYTRDKFTGGGTLAINASTMDFLITKTSNNDLGTAHLDMTGLGAFSANVTNFYVGRGSRTSSTVLLPTTGVGASSITASKLAVGDGAGSGEANGTSYLRFGLTTAISAADIYVAAPAQGVLNVQSGKLEFQTGVTGDSVTIRAADGTSRANMTIAAHGTTKVVRNINGAADFTGGTVDALLGTLIVADGRGYWASSGGIGTVTGTFAMAAGTVDATSVILGRTLSNSSASDTTTGTATGTLNISGGSFTAGSMSLADNNSGTKQAVAANINISAGAAQVTGGITMGTRNGAAISVKPTITLTGGSLTVGGDIAEGANGSFITSAVNLQGGTLDLAGHTLNVDTLLVESGVLGNLGQFNSGGVAATLTKTSAGTLSLTGNSTHTGATSVAAGTLLINGTHAVSGASSAGDYSVSSGATLGGTGSTDAAVTIAGGGTLAPGASIGTFGVGSASINGTLLIEVNDAGSAKVDLLNVAGELDITNAILDFSVIGTPAQPAYVFATYGSLKGTFLSANVLDQPDGYTIDYHYDGQNQIALVIPEPATGLMVVAGTTLGILGRRRRTH